LRAVRVNVQQFLSSSRPIHVFGASPSEKWRRRPESAGTTTKVRESVATRKLKTSGLYDLLKQKSFLQSVYALVEERYRLDSEQDKVRVEWDNRSRRRKQKD
jgi:hypothetical protein